MQINTCLQLSYLKNVLIWKYYTNIKRFIRTNINQVGQELNKQIKKTQSCISWKIFSCRSLQSFMLFPYNSCSVLWSLSWISHTNYELPSYWWSWQCIQWCCHLHPRGGPSCSRLLFSYACLSLDLSLDLTLALVLHWQNRDFNLNLFDSRKDYIYIQYFFIYLL